jgi:regulator of protease activity HflC (stomatin/prohibitin superfamily)
MRQYLTAELLDARLEAAEARTEARMQRIEDTVEAYVQASKLETASFVQVHQETLASIKNLKTTVLITESSTSCTPGSTVAAWHPAASALLLQKGWPQAD